MPLVTYDEQQQYLDIPVGADKELIEDLIAETQALFEKEAGRSHAPFGAAQTGRIEIHPGDAGSSILTLDYPIATITSIGVGRDVAVPDETITPADTTTVVWTVGSRELYRVDGGYWRGWYPTWVKVVYNTVADQPADAKLAVKRLVAGVYNQRGAEGLSTAQRGSRSLSVTAGFAMLADKDPLWQMAVAAHRRGWFR
jgi:hypothetical protein